MNSSFFRINGGFISSSGALTSYVKWKVVIFLIDCNYFISSCLAPMEKDQHDVVLVINDQ